jgi:hypothetical protein
MMSATVTSSGPRARLAALVASLAPHDAGVAKLAQDVLQKVAWDPL